MRHKKKGRKLNRNPSHRKALFCNMATSLLKYGCIETTTPKAKELRGVTEKLITTAKKGGVHNRRLVFRTIKEQDVLKKLFDEIAPKYLNRNGGYTRVVKSGIRKGDNAPLAIIELVASEDTSSDTTAE